MRSPLSRVLRARFLPLLLALGMFFIGGTSAVFFFQEGLHSGPWVRMASLAVALAGLLAASLLGWQRLRAAAQREGARAGRDELLERVSDGFLALDRDFRFVHANSKGVRITRMTREALQGKTLWEVWPELVQHPLGAEYRAAMASSVPRVFEVQWAQEETWLEVRFFPSPEGLSVFLRDVTEKRLMLTALAKSEARHRQIVETAQEGIWILDGAGRITFVNDEVCGLLGYAREELLDKHLFDVMDADGQRIAAENLQRRALGLREHHDFKLSRKDGSTLWGRLATSPLASVEAEGNFTLAMFTDLTDRRRAEAERALLLSRERALRAAAEANHDRYRVLADLVPHVVWTHRADGQVDFVNRCYILSTGQSAEHALGSGWQATLHPEDLPGYLEAWKSALVSGEPLQHEIRMRQADGSWRRHLNLAHAARDPEGRIFRWFGVALELVGARDDDPSTRKDERGWDARTAAG